MATKSKSSKTEVRIGISDSNQELNIECANSQDEVVKSVSEALNSNQTLNLSDTKGRQILISPSKIAFVEVCQSSERKVGFAAD